MCSLLIDSLMTHAFMIIVGWKIPTFTWVQCYNSITRETRSERWSHAVGRPATSWWFVKKMVVVNCHFRSISLRSVLHIDLILVSEWAKLEKTQTITSWAQGMPLEQTMCLFFFVVIWYIPYAKQRCPSSFFGTKNDPCCGEPFSFRSHRQSSPRLVLHQAPDVR